MAPKKAKRRQAAGDGGSSNVFSMFEQSQIQEYKEAFTIIDQNRDGIISKDDLRDVLASMGQLNVKNEELEAMIKEASGPINFTVFLTMFGEKLKGADPEDVILSAFKVLDPEGTGSIKKEFLEELLTTQCDRFSAEEVKICPDFFFSLTSSWKWSFLRTFLFVISPSSDQEHVGRLPPRCGRQRRLQEHLLRHHTRRGEGGVKRNLEDKKDSYPSAFCLPLPPLSSFSSPLTQSRHTCTWDG
uniref:Myosin light chain 11 n=1 Tax=Oryzias latipes TaxID=8090 RepID=H2L9Z5_ORYLA